VIIPTGQTDRQTDRRQTVVFNVCTVSLQSFDITPPKSFLLIIIIIIIIIIMSFRKTRPVQQASIDQCDHIRVVRPSRITALNTSTKLINVEPGY